MKGKRLFLLILLPLSLLAQQVETGGYLKFFVHPNLNAPYPLDHLGTRLQWRLNTSIGDNAAFYSSVDFNYEALQANPAFNAVRGDGLRIYPVETYIDLFFKSMDIRLGQQFIFWGKTDWINPTDNINPWDYVNISAEVEDYRLPVVAGKLNYYLGPLTLQTVLVPRFRANRLPLHLPDTMGGISVRDLPVQLPANKLENSEIGFKADFSLWKVDYALSYYNGYDKNPTIRMHFDPQAHQFLRSIEYDRYQVFGAAFITTFNQWAVKGEGAYVRTKDRTGKDIEMQNPHIKYVLGLDYLPSDKLTLNVQFIQTILLKFDAHYERQSRQQRGMPLSLMPQKYTQSVSGRLQYRLGDFTSLQWITVYNFKDGDYFILPILNYAFCDGINIYGGATIFAGSKTSPFGRNKSYSRAFLEIKYSF